MAGQITTVGDGYLAKARTVPGLEGARRVADVREFLGIVRIPPPFALLVFDGEQAKGGEGVSPNVQQGTQQWSFYVGAASFAPDGGGAFTPAPGAAVGADAETTVDALVGAIQFQTVFQEPGRTWTKAFLESVGLYDVGESVVIYRVRFQNPFARAV